MKKLKLIENGLIPVYQGTKGQAVNARELHEFLEVGTKFADWIKEKIEKYDFIENEDFLSISENSEKPTGGRPTTEYILKLDTAKEIAMVQNNTKGKEIRKYFIRVEKKYKENNISTLDANDPIQALQLMNNQIGAVLGTMGKIGTRVNKLEEEDFIKPFQKKALIGARTRKVYAITGGKNSQAYQNKSFRSRVYQDIFRNIKNIYNINEYDAIPKQRFGEAMTLVNEYQLPLQLKYELQSIGDQTKINEEAI